LFLLVVTLYGVRSDICVCKRRITMSRAVL